MGASAAMTARRELTLRIEPREYDALRAHAAVTGTSLNKTVSAAIRAYLQAHESDFEAAVARVRADYREALDALG